MFLLVMSFVEMTKFLLSQPQDPATTQKLYLLSEHLSQDPLESRGLGGEGTRIPIYNSVCITLQHCVCRNPWLWIQLEVTAAGRGGYSVISNQQ